MQTTLIAPPKTLVRHHVLAAKDIRQREGEHPNCVVLAFDPDDYQRFVTWVAYTPDGGATWEACWGHYFQRVEDAVADFADRH